MEKQAINPEMHLEKESQEMAEDRLLDLLEKVGITCYSWKCSEVEEDEDE